MFRTGFLVRATHTLLTWVVTLVLFLHNTGKSVKLGRFTSLMQEAANQENRKNFIEISLCFCLF